MIMMMITVMIIIIVMMIIIIMIIMIIMMINLDKINSIFDTDNFLIITKPRPKLKPSWLPPMSLLSEVKRREHLVSRLRIRGAILQLPHSNSWCNASINRLETLPISSSSSSKLFLYGNFQWNVIDLKFQQTVLMQYILKKSRNDWLYALSWSGGGVELRIKLLLE
jgi:hypothetical protein